MRNLVGYKLYGFFVREKVKNIKKHLNYKRKCVIMQYDNKIGVEFGFLPLGL